MSIEVQKQKNKEMQEKKSVEDAFLAEEREAVRKEHNDMLATKRLIDKMMFSDPENRTVEICSLLANFQGIKK